MSDASSQTLTPHGADGVVYLPPDRRTLLVTALLLEGALVGLAFLLGWWWKEPPLRYLHWSWSDLWISVLGTLPLIAFVVLLDCYPLGPLRRLRDECIDIWNALLQSSGWWDLALYSALAGFCEEVLFRGVLQPAIAYHLDAPAGILLAALLFGLAHPLSISYVVVVFLIGIYLGVLLEVTDNLLVVILIHGLYDLVAMAYLKWRLSHRELAPPQPR